MAIDRKNVKLFAVIDKQIDAYTESEITALGPHRAVGKGEMVIRGFERPLRLLWVHYRKMEIAHIEA